jgi:hypothetical protein
MRRPFRRAGESRNPFSDSRKSNEDSGLRRHDDGMRCAAEMDAEV